jgi:uncharacterized RDD family membrane protein YckC
MTNGPVVTQLRLATWGSRFWAWLIDIILVGIIASVILEPVTTLIRPGAPHPFSGIERIATHGVLQWIYWTVLEGKTGQSAGKIVMRIRLTAADGTPAGYMNAAIESFGKAFLLVIDCLIGWLAMGGQRLRLFNRISGTIVITDTLSETPEGVEYIKEGEETKTLK